MNNTNHIRIADAAKMLSVSTKTLRRWEKKGRLVPKRSTGNQRYYDLEAIHNFKLSLENKLPIENSQNIQNKKDISSLKRKVFGFSVLTAVVGIASFGIILGNEGIIGNKKENERKITQTNNSKGPEGSVLATSTGLDDTTIGQKYTFNINVPSKFNEVVTFVKDITAPNIVNSLNSKTGDVTFGLTAGTGITVDGLKITNSGVTSLTAGTGISVSGSTITNSNLGSSQNIFKNVAITGQTTVSGDSNTDTLTLLGSGVTIATDATNDYLTFSSATVDFTNTGWTDGGTDVYATTISDYVGIGTNDPSYNLEVTGTGYFSDTLTLNGALSVSGTTNLNGNVTFGNAITDTVTFTGRLAAGSTILPDTDLGSDLGSSGLRFNNLYVANIISNSSSTFSGQTTFTYAPTDATISQASVIINPTTAVANGQLIGFAVNSLEVGAVDKEGDLTLGYSGLASIPENSYPLSVYNHGTTQVAYIDTSGNTTLSGNIDINGTTNDIAGTLNLSGNALTSSGALTITPAAGNDLNIVTSGAGDVVVNTNQFVVDASDAKVGIGTAAPTSKLHVTGAVTGKALTILDETGDQNILVASASGATKFVIDHDGNVGIGMTSPSVKMDIEAVSGTDALRFTSSGTKILGISTGTNAGRIDLNNTTTNLLTNGTFESDTTSWSGTQTHTLNDEFTTNRAAGAVNGTSAEPTGGTRTVTDTNNVLSISNNQLTVASGGVTYGNPGLWYGSISRSAGLVFTGQLNHSAGIRSFIGFDTDTTSAPGGNSFYYPGNGTLMSYTDSVTSSIAEPVNGTTYSYSVVLRGTTGAYLYIKGGTFTNWTLLWISSSNSSTTLYPSVIGQITGAFTADNIHIPTATFLPTPLAYDTFTRGDGAIGSTETTGPDSQTTPSLSWTGGAISSNTNVITPSVGSTVLTNGDFTNWTGDNPDNWTLIMTEDANNYITEAGPTGQARIVTGVGGATGMNQNSVLTSGIWYEVSANVTSYTSGALNFYLGNGNLAGQSLFGSTGVKTYSGRSSGILFQINRTSTEDITLDDLTVKPLTLSSLFSTVSTSDKDVIASVDITSTAVTQAGVVTNLNDATTPTAGIIAYMKRATTSDSASNVYLDKFTTATTWTNLTSGTVTYVAGATLRVVTYHSDANTLKVRVYYNNALVGSEQTITDAAIINNTIHGLFSTYSGNTFDNFSLYARGSDGEYEQLTPTDLTVTHEVTTTLAGSSGSAKLVAPASYYNDFTQSVNVGGTGTYTLTAHAYTDGNAVTSSDLELYYNTTTITTTFTPLDAQSGWYKLTGTFTGVASSLPVGVRVKAGKTVYLDNVSVISGTTTASTVYVANNTTGTANLNVLGLVDGTDSGVATLSKAGAVSDSDFATDYDGLLGVDTTNHRLYFREGGSWSYIARTGGFQIPKEETEGLSIGDLVIPYVESTMSDGALHGMYKKYDDVIKNRSLDTLSVLGDSTFSDTLVSGKLDIGKISFDGLSFSLSGDENLKIQSSSLNGIDFLNRKITISKDGLITLNSDITGNEVLTANQNEIIVNKSWKTKPTTIITTPSFNTSVFVSDITENGFKIHTGNISEKDEIINWVSIW